MHEGEAGAAVELGEDGLEALVAEVDAAVVREEDDPVGAERVERVGELGQAAVQVRER
jgi:hypothetical protein